MDKVDRTALIDDCRAVGRAAAQLLEANDRLRARGLHDAVFTGLAGNGRERLQAWRRWIAANLGVEV